MALTPAQQAQLSDLMLALGAKGAKTRKQIAALVRENADDPRVKPFLNEFPDIAAEAAAVDPDDKPMSRKELTAALAEDEGRRREDAAKRERGAQRQKLVESGRFTEEAMTGLDAFMKENGYENYEHGAVLYAHENPPANSRPTIGSSKQWSMPDSAEYRKDPKKAALNKAYEVVGELRGTQRA